MEHEEEEKPPEHEEVEEENPAELAEEEVGESHPDFIVQKARQFEHNTTTIMEKIKEGDIIPYKKREDQESGYNLRMQFKDPFKIDDSNYKPDDINKIYKADIILLETDKPGTGKKGTIYMSLLPDKNPGNEELVIDRVFIISDNNPVDIICDFSKIFQEGGKRKTNKRKTNKRKTHKRKTHKRKTHKRRHQ